jgi:hypothetical protein
LRQNDEKKMGLQKKWWSRADQKKDMKKEKTGSCQQINCPKEHMLEKWSPKARSVV